MLLYQSASVNLSDQGVWSAQGLPKDVKREDVQAMSATVVRPARDEDLEGVMDLYAEFHAFHVAGVPDRLRPMPPQSAHEREELREVLRQFLRDVQAALLIAEQDGHLIGLAEVQLRR